MKGMPSVFSRFLSRVRRRMLQTNVGNKPLFFFSFRDLRLGVLDMRIGVRSWSDTDGSFTYGC